MLAGWEFWQPTSEPKWGHTDQAFGRRFRMSDGHTVTVQGLGERLPVERPEDCVSRTLSASGAGLVAGGIMGAVTANWGKVPPVLADRPWPALKHTGATFELCSILSNVQKGLFT